MDELNLRALLQDESFVNYCRRTEKEDIEKWEKWLQKYPEHQQSIAELKETILAMGYYAGEVSVQANYFRLQQQIKKHSNQNRFKEIGKTVWFKIAAAVLAVGTVSLFLFQQQAPKETIEIVQHIGSPGQDAALLTLKDGSVISLTDIRNGSVVALQGGVEIQKSKNGELVYKAVEQDGAAAAAVNKITTNRGNQYQVILPDGSKAFLNANSTLTYPLKFANDARSVRMTGEIYFEVAKMDRGTDGKRIPFYVETAEQKIEVLGTHFNVNAYQDEPYTTTTLLEGSVRVTSLKMNESVLLKPGQRALLSERLRVDDIDISQDVAWIAGDFVFKGEELGSLLRKISRWYNVDVECPQRLNKLKFDGMVSRSQPLSTIMDMLQTTGKVKLTLNGRRLIVID
ncbi:FecR family protein [Sphingobacterium sp. BIGb0165]|uniref:FecR family protein n=1 Tax=Sphingobacterium sp. BIGb0165 TaxID=2940615 RepID=UPI00216884CA|nr:FecR domain-containing protein [Sphingobacterium sp. BIGb0165]MCS4228779.1 ferric-dicitrate binding protein FerR (iron transport regulator) [Sphingobacterium sp. BIGb0165]